MEKKKLLDTEWNGNRIKMTAEKVYCTLSKE